MNYVGKRIHPRVYKKNKPDRGEKSLTISAAAAAGVLACAFLKGLFWGYMLKKRLDK